jgi:hypothetical protein
VGDRLRLDGTIAADIAMSGFYVNFDVGYSRSVLPAIVLFFHENIHLVHGIGRAILFDVIGEWLSQTNEGNSAFVKDVVAHVIRR